MSTYQTLSNGVKIPMIGFGVFQTKSGDETVNAVKWAIEAGYTHIDTAFIYGNEESVGQAIKESGIARGKLFVTTKLWNACIREGTTKEAFYKSLENLQLDYIDLYLIHWPTQGRNEAWKVMEELYEEGKIKAIGVSNFQKHHYEELMQTAKIKPMVNQIESNPRFNNDELIEFCKEQGIVVEAWSPLGGNGTSMLGNETLIKIGEKYGKSAAQVVIRWNIQKNVVVLPKSANKGRIAQNIDVYDFELTKEDMDTITELNQNTRSGADPDNFNF
ncbi:MAG: aldo/keto reductase [Clostridia bacterium]